MPFAVMPDAGRQLRGRTSYHAGCAAEDGVAAEYERQGCTILRRRWRGRAGEIDLIAEKDGALIFVEVKKSRSFAAAAARPLTEPRPPPPPLPAVRPTTTPPRTFRREDDEAATGVMKATAAAADDDIFSQLSLCVALCACK